ncbi:MAG TPA: sulfite exporter TauE/SafE family protein, partial [Rhizomicrobium sp.]|nr:sulfite exporter TauE/SafE family protein [Rhizomicrobium sp.]
MANLLAHIDPLYVISGVLVGGLVGFTGVGGGSLMTPILILIFGVHPASAVGTDLLYAAATKTGGSLVHGYNRTIDWTVVGRLALGSVPMTALSVLLLYWLGVDSKASQAIITKALGVALLATAILLFLRKPIMAWYDRAIGEPNPALVARLTVLTGAALGVLVTLSSVGAGAIGVTALVMLYPKMPAQRIVGSD